MKKNGISASGGKKILFVSPYFKPHTGGLENYVANIEKGLRSQGWKTVVATSNELGKPFQEDMVDGTKVYRLPICLKFSNTPINPLWYFYLKKIIKKEKPDLINAHAPVPFISDMAALAAGKIPFVLTYHSGTMKKGKIFVDPLIWMYENFLLEKTARRAEKIICPSRFVISSLLKKFEKKAVVISPGVDTNIFKPSMDIENEKKTVLFVARFANMHKMKGLDYLTQVMKKMPDVTLKIIGESAEESAKNIIFLGTKTVRETAREMQNCTLLVLPSLAKVESFGMVLIEAMASGKPVVATNSGGIPEIIDSGIDGILVAPSDSDSLFFAMDRIIQDQALAKIMAKNGFDKAKKNYVWKNKILETNKIFLRVIKKYDE